MEYRIYIGDAWGSSKRKGLIVEIRNGDAVFKWMPKDDDIIKLAKLLHDVERLNKDWEK